MVTASIICILTAAVLGVILLWYVVQRKPTPKGLAFVHGPLAITGLIILIVYAITTASHHKHLESISLFAVAAALGVVLIYKDLTGKKTPKWLAWGACCYCRYRVSLYFVPHYEWPLTVSLLKK